MQVSVYTMLFSHMVIPVLICSYTNPVKGGFDILRPLHSLYLPFTTQQLTRTYHPPLVQYDMMYVSAYVIDMSTFGGSSGLHFLFKIRTNKVEFLVASPIFLPSPIHLALLSYPRLCSSFIHIYTIPFHTHSYPHISPEGFIYRHSVPLQYLLLTQSRRSLDLLSVPDTPQQQ